MNTVNYDYTLQELQAEMVRRFGMSTPNWTVQCPLCKTTFTAQQVCEAYMAQGVEEAEAQQKTLSGFGQECIGRVDPEQGCDWAAYGLLVAEGTISIQLPDGKIIAAFPIADVLTKEAEW